MTHTQPTTGARGRRPLYGRRLPVLIWTALLVAVTAAYAAALMRVMACDVTRLRWEREFSGWRTILRDRVAKCAPRAAPPIAGCGYFARRRWHRTCGCGWRSVQRARIAARRWDRALR